MPKSALKILPRIGWRPRRDDAFPISIFRRDGKRTVHIEGLHAHDFFSMLFVDGGQGTVKLVGRSIKLKRGDVHLLPPGEPHDTRGLGPVVGWVVEFTADALGDAHGFFGSHCGRPRWLGFQRLGGLGGGKLSLPDVSCDRVGLRLAAMDREFKEGGPAYQEAARALLQLALIEISRAGGSRNSLPPRPAPLVEEVFTVIDQRYAEPLGLASVAKAVGRSASYVTNLVRTQTGLTVLEWITERRLDEARRRLRESDEDIAIIADRVGYTTVDHFIRQFRRAHGMPPGAWRRALAPSDVPHR